jgi:hypothetical protein
VCGDVGACIAERTETFELLLRFMHSWCAACFNEHATRNRCFLELLGGDVGQCNKATNKGSLGADKCLVQTRWIASLTYRGLGHAHDMVGMCEEILSMPGHAWPIVSEVWSILIGERFLLQCTCEGLYSVPQCPEGFATPPKTAWARGARTLL